MKPFRHIFTLLACIFAVIGIFMATPIPAFADNCTDICSAECTSVPDSIKAASGCPGHAAPDLQTAVINIINGIILALGTVAVIFIVYGGVTYITSLGDTGKVKKGRDAILYSLIGLVICVLAYAIVNFAAGILNKSDEPITSPQNQESTSQPAVDHGAI